MRRARAAAPRAPTLSAKAESRRRFAGEQASTPHRRPGSRDGTQRRSHTLRESAAWSTAIRASARRASARTFSAARPVPSPARTLRLQQLRELHGQRAGATPPLRDALVANGAEHRSPVDARVLPEASVFAIDDRRDQRGRNGVERRPLETDDACSPAAAVRAARRSDRAATLRKASTSISLSSKLSTLAGTRNSHAAPASAAKRPAPPTMPPTFTKPFHGVGSTVTGCSGISPNISGAYIASTRVAGQQERAGIVESHGVLDDPASLRYEAVVRPEHFEPAFFVRRTRPAFALLVAA